MSTANCHGSTVAPVYEASITQYKVSGQCKDEDRGTHHTKEDRAS